MPRKPKSQKSEKTVDNYEKKIEKGLVDKDHYKVVFYDLDKKFPHMQEKHLNTELQNGYQFVCFCHAPGGQIGVLYEKY